MATGVCWPTSRARPWRSGAFEPRRVEPGGPRVNAGTSRPEARGSAASAGRIGGESKGAPLSEPRSYEPRHLGVCDLRWPNLALERDEEGCPDKRAMPVPAHPASGAPRVWKIKLPTTLPPRPKLRSQCSPYPPPFMTIPASQPVIIPTTIDATNISKYRSEEHTSELQSH